jgi:2-succinyl-6-hydroxy-2,4-cyclohexadiene-1-carboxylate synthase
MRPVTGFELHAEVDGAGPRLVLLHGFTQTRCCWGRIATDLATDHEVVRVDAPGHGRSAEVLAGLRTGARLIADVGGRGCYVGYSMGGRFALHVALAHPELVTGLVLVGATPGIEDDAERARRAEADELMAQRVEREGVDAFVEAWLAQPLFAGLGPEAAFADARRENTVEGLASSLRQAGTGSQDPRWAELPRLAMPVLVVAGGEDRKYAEIGERTASAIGAQATFATIGGAGHAAHLEDPDAFLALLRSWLSANEL